MQSDNLNILAFMSGSSLDGMDIGLISVNCEKERYSYEIVKAVTIPYSKLWAEALKKGHESSGKDLVELDFKYAEYCAEHLNVFIENSDVSVDLISYHGHTIFHNPDRNYTYALGNLATLSALTNTKTVGRFRDSDVSLGGQGAPLMAIADELLFQEYKVNINLGGICNVSVSGERKVAYDICPCNQLFNEVYFELGIDYDQGGILCSKGDLMPSLYDSLNADDYYRKSFPKSLDNNYIREHILDLVRGKDLPQNKLFTIAEFVAKTIANELSMLVEKGFISQGDSILFTGGGTLNNYFIKKITRLLEAMELKVVIPSEELINYKELVLMALLGFMRINNQLNIKKLATGALRNSLAGGIYEC